MMNKIKKIEKGIWGAGDITIERVEEYNEHDTLVVMWELRKNGVWIDKDSFRTLRDAKQWVVANWTTL
jgi:hypothetical protein